jgi:hypothetical protein
VNTRLQLTCTICGKELSGGLDTFGDIGEELCQDCWIRLPYIVDGWIVAKTQDPLLQAELDDEKLQTVKHENEM